jgi:hypothetical protein
MFKGQAEAIATRLAGPECVCENSVNDYQSVVNAMGGVAQTDDFFRCSWRWSDHDGIGAINLTAGATEKASRPIRSRRTPLPGVERIIDRRYVVPISPDCQYRGR